MQAAGRIDDQRANLAGLGGMEGVEDDGARVGALRLADDLGLSALGPNFELLDGGGAEGVGSAEQDGFAVVLQALGEFADGGGFAGAVDADHHDDPRRLIGLHQRAFGGFEHTEQVFLDELAEFRGVVHQVAGDPLADGFEDIGGGADADIGRNQRVFKLFEEIGVDLLLAVDHVFDAVHESGAGFLYALFQAVQKAGH
jgi:hypothetical protein